MTFNTGNNVPSTDPRDLYDNAQNFDKLIVGPEPSYLDRLGVPRKSWAGMEADFTAFLAASGFESTHLIYVDGQLLTVDRPTQLIDYDGSVYRVKMPASFPLELSGVWVDDAPLLLDVGDESLRLALATNEGAGLIGMDLGGTYADGTLGKAILDALSTPKENAAWAGFFACWPMGHALTAGTTERVQLPAGVTHGRAGFAAGTTITHADGQKAADALRIQRNAGDTDTSNHTVCINLTAEETKPLRGKRCTMHLFARRGADYSGATITYRVQGSVEPEQPILSSVGNYTNGHEVLATADVLPGLNQPDVPYSLTLDVPSDMTQLAIVVVVRFTGTAGTSDFIELEDACIYPGRRVYPAARPDFAALLNKAATRYQASYPYGVPVGSNTHQGAVTSIANGAAVNWAVHANVRFAPRMIAPPRVQFLAPSSGIRSRWLNPAASTFLSGIAFDVSDSGVSITNNAAAVDGTRYLCQWAADVLF
ncbi:hypothetical protein ACQKEK_02595 [Pseudomonas sp. NPDC077408]|uniref:hypothetical protein n=1 Tax=Streptomyces parvus TaxID=66428 RepID=UPI0037100E20